VNIQVKLHKLLSLPSLTLGLRWQRKMEIKTFTDDFIMIKCGDYGTRKREIPTTIPSSYAATCQACP
jgi:hypothetical protein